MHSALLPVAVPQPPPPIPSPHPVVTPRPVQHTLVHLPLPAPLPALLLAALYPCCLRCSHACSFVVFFGVAVGGGWFAHTEYGPAPYAPEGCSEDALEAVVEFEAERQQARFTVLHDAWMVGCQGGDGSVLLV